MSNLELNPEEKICDPEPITPSSTASVEIITPRMVPLGGPRAMPVRRTLPAKQRSTVGAWCFADHYGPDNVAETGGMDVAPHPHTGLQTASWLFTGEIEHNDTMGNHAMVLPGELNLMTAGHGISHTEVSTKATTILHGIQLWIVLPDSARETARNFQHFAPEPVALDGGIISVFIGEVGDAVSPVETFTPMVGAEVNINPGQSVTLPLRTDFEHCFIVDTGAIEISGQPVARAELGYLSPGLDSVTVQATGDEPVRAMLLGGEPFEEEIVMWWNFIGRTHEEIVEYRRQWEDDVERGERFGNITNYPGPRLNAPPLPNARLRPRFRPGQAPKE